MYAMMDNELIFNDSVKRGEHSNVRTTLGVPVTSSARRIVDCDTQIWNAAAAKQT